MSGWRWLGEALVLAIHDEQIAEHGGPIGVRDPGLLSSALARPRHLAAYGKPDAGDLAAAYAFGIVRNHPFVDGNKRTAFVAALVFLGDNGFDIDADELAMVRAMLDLSAGQMIEAAFADWLRHRTVRIESAD